ncbi:hypothetical protein SFRURICE_014905, partial [Spodoptera frugiperda]
MQFLLLIFMLEPRFPLCWPNEIRKMIIYGANRRKRVTYCYGLTSEAHELHNI